MEKAWIDELEEDAESRFSNWQPQTWQSLLAGPAAQLLKALEATGRPMEKTRPVAKSYLSLAAEAVGMGYLYPTAQTGRANFFSLAWFDLLPKELASLSPQRQTEVLSACWNVGENLETRASWFQILFLTLMARDGLNLESFEVDVQRVTEMILDRPEVALNAEDYRLEWIPLGVQDARFLPGQVQFLAPQVLVVDHRHGGLDDRPKSAKVVWLGEGPQVLGAAGDALRNREGVGDTEKDDPAWSWEKVRDDEPRLTSIHAQSSNRWRAVCTLETSQFLVMALSSPAGE